NPLGHAAVEIAGGAGAGVKDGPDGDATAGGVVGDGVVELVGPVGITAGTDHAAKDFEIEDGHEALAVGLDIAAGDAPEVAGFGAGAVEVGMGEMVGTHIDTGSFAVAH